MSFLLHIPGGVLGQAPWSQRLLVYAKIQHKIDTQK